MIRGRVHISLLLLFISHSLFPISNFFSRKDHTPVTPLRILPNGALDPAQCDLSSPDNNYFNQLKIGRHDRLSLPPSLHDLKNYELCHLPSLVQEGPSSAWYIPSILQEASSCAWYMSLNAKAIQTIVQRQEPLTAAAIGRYLVNQLIPFVRQNDNFFKNQLGLQILMGVNPFKITKLFSHFGLTNYYNVVILARKNNDIFWVSQDNLLELGNHAWAEPVPCNNETFFIVNDLHALLRIIKQKPEPISHILLSVPSSGNVLHAVLLTIIKRGDQKPLILYLNSNGTSLNLSFVERLIDSTGATENKYISNFIKALDNA